MNYSLYRGDLQNALDSCAFAVKILDGYDDEGALGYHCYVIEDQSNHPEHYKP
jgi:hypothetical protein